MCRFLVFDRKLEFQVKSQNLGKNGSLWGGTEFGQNVYTKVRKRTYEKYKLFCIALS